MISNQSFDRFFKLNQAVSRRTTHFQATVTQNHTKGEYCRISHAGRSPHESIVGPSHSKVLSTGNISTTQYEESWFQVVVKL